MLAGLGGSRVVRPRLNSPGTNVPYVRCYKDSGYKRHFGSTMTNIRNIGESDWSSGLNLWHP